MNNVNPDEQKRLLIEIDAILERIGGLDEMGLRAAGINLAELESPTADTWFTLQQYEASLQEEATKGLRI